jgi:Zn-dependent protease
MRLVTMDVMSQRWPAPPTHRLPPVDPPAFEEPAAPGAIDATGRGPAAPDDRPWWRRGLSTLVVAGLLVLKWGKALLLLLPKAKLLTTSGSMLVSIVAYSFIWGWKFAAGFVLLLLVHEMGHVIQLRREGIEASAPMFIPFLGAAVMAKSLGDDATAEARVGLAGPILGTLGCLALLPVAFATGEDFWYALIFTGLFLNLFNLLPVVPLDGGRAMAALSPWMWFVGLFVMAVVAFVYPNPIIFLILLLAAYETYKRWKARKAGGDEVQAYYAVKPVHRVAILGVYLGLILVCVIGMGLTHVERSIPS